MGTVTGATLTFTNGTITNATTTNTFASRLTANTTAFGQTGSTTISSTGAPYTPSATIAALNGIIKGTSGVLSAATLGTDYINNSSIDTSAELATILTNETGSGALVFGTSPTLVTPILGTPTSVTLTNATGLPVATGISGLGTGVATFLATPSSANLATAVTNETGSGLLVFGTSPSLTTPAIAGATLSGTISGGTFSGGTWNGAGLVLHTEVLVP